MVNLILELGANSVDSGLQGAAFAANISLAETFIGYGANNFSGALCSAIENKYDDIEIVKMFVALGATIRYSLDDVASCNIY